MSDQFRQWLAAEMKERRYSQAALARAMGISQPFVSRVLRGQKPVSVDFALKVAQVLDQPPETVLRLAGLLPDLPADEHDPLIGAILDLAKRMNKQQRHELLRFAKFLFEQSRKDKS